MADPFRKVAPGEPMSMPAVAYNAFVDAAKDYQRRRQGNGGASSIDVRQSGSVALIKNTSATDIDRFGVLGIDGTVFTPTDLESFKNQFAMSGSVPDIALHVGKFVVALEPISAGEMGLCLVNGIVAVQIDVVTESDSFADITDDDATCLTSGPAGCAQILWKESGTGKKWAVVRIGTPSAGDVLLGKPTAAYTSGVTITLVTCDSAGVSNGRPNVTVQAGWTLPANTNIPTTAIIPYQKAADGNYYAVGQGREVITNIQYDTSSHKLQKKVRLDFGTFSTTESSAWIDITTAVSCS